MKTLHIDTPIGGVDDNTKTRECVGCGEMFPIEELQSDPTTKEVFCEECGQKGDYYANLAEDRLVDMER